MNSFIGYIFTDGPAQELNDRGFAFIQDDTGLSQGYRSFQMTFADFSTIEIREIIDERTYLDIFKINHFEPLAGLVTFSIGPIENENTVYNFQAQVRSQDLEACELRSYLEIRKEFPLWAVWLRCRDFKKFCQVAKPDRLFQWKGREIGLIHMGPNCFDFIISE